MEMLDRSSITTSDARALSETVRPMLEGLAGVVKELEGRGVSRRTPVYSGILRAYDAVYYLSVELQYQSISRGGKRPPTEGEPHKKEPTNVIPLRPFLAD